MATNDTSSGSSDRSVAEIQILLNRLRENTSAQALAASRTQSGNPSDVTSWQAVNRLLRQHGLQSVNAVAISELLPTSEGLLLGSSDVAQLLKAISQLAADGEHSRRLNHDLLKQLSGLR